MTRVPIPKPGRIDEYRPLSLCDDIFCFVSRIVAQRTSEAIERAGTLHDGIATYRKGKGCAFLNETELAVREDVLWRLAAVCSTNWRVIQSIPPRNA